MANVKYPDGHVFLRKMDRVYPKIDRGEGVYLFDQNGKKYFDAAGGALVISVGHGDKEIVAKITKQLERVSYINGTQFTSDVTEKLADKLSDLSQRSGVLGPRRASFLCSGSEAIEAAIKFARQVWFERGELTRGKVIARTPGYHGNTLYALSASGRPHYKKVFGPLLSDVSLIPAPYRYRSHVEDYEKKGGAYYADFLEKEIIKLGPENVAAFVVEPVIGTSAGGATPPPDYFEHVQRICKKYGVLTIADEVLCGTGRVGTFFACELMKLNADIVVLGKGIGGGYAPLSCVLVRPEHVEEIRKGSGNSFHAQTYLQAPFVTAAGLAVIEKIEEKKLLLNAQNEGARLQKFMREEILPLPHVGAVDGIGLLAGIEFVQDKATRKPFDRSKKFAEKFAEHAFSRGLILWSNVGQADGIHGDIAALGPSLAVTSLELESMIQQVKEAILSFTAP